MSTLHITEWLAGELIATCLAGIAVITAWRRRVNARSSAREDDSER